MKFLHAADIHLDSPLAGLTRRAVVPAHVTRECTRRAFANLVDLAIAEDVAFVLIAGDLFDADWRDFSTGLFFAAEMRRLGRPCVLVRGNHDFASEITKRLVQPPNVRELSSRTCDRVGFDELGVVIHGRSFPNRAVPEDLSADYPAREAGRLNIGLLHTSAEDPGEHATYAPCRVESLVLKGYDYWALGHIHDRRTLHERPFVVFPGNTQGRNPRETGAKGATLVEVQDRQIVNVTHCPTDVLRWTQVAVDADGAQNLAELSARVGAALAAANDGAEGRPLIARVALGGVTPLHAAMLADPDAIDAECRNAAAGISGELHIERVRLRTATPGTDIGDDGAMAALAQAFMAGLDDPDLQARALEDLRRLASQMPRLPGSAPPSLPTTAEALRLLAADAWQEVAHALSGAP